MASEQAHPRPALQLLQSWPLIASTRLPASMPLPWPSQVPSGPHKVHLQRERKVKKSNTQRASCWNNPSALVLILGANSPRNEDGPVLAPTLLYWRGANGPSGKAWKWYECRVSFPLLCELLWLSLQEVSCILQRPATRTLAATAQLEGDRTPAAAEGCLQRQSIMCPQW